MSTSFGNCWPSPPLCPAVGARLLVEVTEVIHSRITDYAGFSSSPSTSFKSRKSASYQSTGHEKGKSKAAVLSLTRADVNSRDTLGRTLLHLAASSQNDSARAFVAALLEVPILDLYAQDIESGWTALHRAFYFGNVAIAQAILARDARDANDYSTNFSHHQAGGLVKIKDHEGNSPFEVFGQSVAARSLQQSNRSLTLNSHDEASVQGDDMDESRSDHIGQRKSLKAVIDLDGDEVFAFGSNKNLTLGLGDGDDRQYPERPGLERPQYLFEHFTQELFDMDRLSSDSHAKTTEITALVKYRPIRIQDVVMAKFHTAILTDDPQSNLFVCGFGPSGRLGVGDEGTRFKYVCVDGGGLGFRRVTSIALGQYHTIAITSNGETFTWGSNKYGQLGYTLPFSGSSKDAPKQLLPRQLFGTLKKEAIIGAAASSVHSAIFTTAALYTFGKNDGQLGLVDADARSLEMQVIPRRVGVSLFQAAIQMVTATDSATCVLLESHEVIVFVQYGFSRVLFPLEGFTNYFLQGSLSTRYDSAGNFIKKVTAGGNTLGALSNFGEVFTVEIPRQSDTASAISSTTNPTRARNALPTPSKVWSIKKAHMSAEDVAIGQDGSIILCTTSGSVWRKEKRVKITSISRSSQYSAKLKDYKFVRVPNLTRIVAIRSNAFGAFAAVRRDTTVMREEIVVNSQSLWGDMFSLLSFKAYQPLRNEGNTRRRFWMPSTRGPSCAGIKHAILTAKDPEEDFKSLMQGKDPLGESNFDLWVTSNVSNVKIAAHASILKARSSVLRAALAQFQTNYYFSISETISIAYGSDGQVELQCQSVDFLTIMNLVFYAYTDNLVDVWHHTSEALAKAPRYRQVRADLMKLAVQLEMPQLEKAVRVMVDPQWTMDLDFEYAFRDERYFLDADVTIDLADNVELSAHSSILCQRCPFFEGLFHGRAGGRWLDDRRENDDAVLEMVRVDLRHVEEHVFLLVLRHIYADTGDELFNKTVTKDLDEFIDLILEVLSIANELMLERLAQVCQKMLGTFGRNCCAPTKSMLMPLSDHAKCMFSFECSSALLGHRI